MRFAIRVRARYCLFMTILSSIAIAGGATEYSAPVGKDYPKRVLWGDTHLHTRNSADAYSLGNMNLTPADAYRFARGQAVVAHNGMQVQLRRPLDFLVVVRSRGVSRVATTASTWPTRS